MKIKAKIALAAGPDGQWYAYGASAIDGQPWGEIMNAFAPIDGERRFWITAEIEVPDDEPVIVGAAESAPT